MATTVRKNVFETNSSSSHSITIGTGQDWDNIPLNKKGNVILKGGGFGWEICSYNDALTKANYCAIDQLWNPNRIQMLKEVIKDFTWCNKVKIKANVKNYNSKYYSYIDHESYGTSENAFKSLETLKNFIFNKNSILYTDNDNH